MKRVTAILLSVLLVLAGCPMTAFGETMSLTDNTTVSVVLEQGEVLRLSFTPTVTQMYEIQSIDDINADPVAALYDSDDVLIGKSDDDGVDHNFLIAAELTAGCTYYLDVWDYNHEKDAAFTVWVKSVVPTSITVVSNLEKAFVGAYTELGVQVLPSNASGHVSWSTSDPTVAVPEGDGIRFLKEGTVTLTATTYNGLTDSCEVTVHAVTPITVGQTLTNTVSAENGRWQAVSFTPQTDGKYRLKSSNNVSDTGEDEELDVLTYLYDERCAYLAMDDDEGENVNFALQYVMEAGKTYYFLITPYVSDACGSYDVTLESVPTATAVSIDGGDRQLAGGERVGISLNYTPYNAWAEEYTVVSSDPSVIVVSGTDIYAINNGEATVTVTTESGLTDSVQVSCQAFSSLEVDTTYSSADAEKENGYSWFRFVPTVSGRYSIRSFCESEDVDPHVCLRDSQFGYIVDNDDRSDTNRNFLLTAVLNAGETYYFSVYSGEGTDDVCDIRLERIGEDYPSVTPDEELSVMIERQNDSKAYSFEPTVSGIYCFQSFDEKNDTRIFVYDSEWNQLYFSDDISVSDRNFRLTEMFAAGKCYYIVVNYYSDESGSFTMRATAEELFVTGDIDGDGEATTLDVVALFDGVSGAAALSEVQEAVADVNGDGAINTIDVTELFAIVSGQ